MDNNHLGPNDADRGIHPPRADSPNPYIDGIIGYVPDLDFAYDISCALRDLEREQLSRTTEVLAVQCASKWDDYKQATLDERQLKSVLEEESVPSFQLFSVSRFLRRSSRTPIPDDAQKLRINSTAFRQLIKKHEIPASMIAALSRPYQTTGTGSRDFGSTWSYWCLLPVRVPVSCTNGGASHAKSTAGSNQMDPFHYIHLSDARVDIRGSHIAMFLRYDKEQGSTMVIVLNLLDGRWSKIAEEPVLRVKEVIKSRKDAQVKNEPPFVPLVYLSSIVRWWNNVLSFFNHQLIAHEKRLQDDMESTNSTNLDMNTVINKALHIMAAHLHRYSSELERLENVVLDIMRCHDKLHFLVDLTENCQGGSSQHDQGWLRAKLAYEQILSQLRAIRAFGKELERKIENILALLFNQIQVANDRTMQAILQAAQNEAAESHKLAVSMKEDSIAMKTIAILTMAFLPGTSYAALLSMPFFDDNTYMSAANRVWIWILLTVPSTAGAFLFYWWLTRRRRKRISKETDAEAATAAASVPKANSNAAASSNTSVTSKVATPTSPSSSQGIPMQVLGQQIA